MSGERRILIIAYHFPPDAAVGALRPQKFAKYLPEFGWKPYVLTIKERFIGKRDEGRLADVAGVPVSRTTFLRTPLQFMLDTRDRFRRRPHGNSSSGMKTGKVSPVSGAGAAVPLSQRTRLARLFISLNWLPDDKVFWTVPAIVKGYFLIRREKIRVIYATAPPHSTMIPAVILAKLTGARLILDFRDPWTLNFRLPENMEHPLYYRLNGFLERWAIMAGDRVVVVTERFRNHLIAAFPMMAERIRVVENGYDDSDIPSSGPTGRNSKYTISYLGTFYLDRNPRTVLKALADLVREQFLHRDDFEVRFIGAVDQAGGESVKSMVEEAGLTENVLVLGKVPYASALQEMANADVLLLLAPNQPFQIPAKTYEYLATGNPILALTEDGATADLIRRTGGGIVAAPLDVDNIKDVIRTLVLNRDTDQYRLALGERRQFSRRHLTGHLAALLDELWREM